MCQNEFHIKNTSITRLIIVTCHYAILHLLSLRFADFNAITYYNIDEAYSKLQLVLVNRVLVLLLIRRMYKLIDIHQRHI